MTEKKRVLAMLLAGLLAVVMLFSIFFIILEADHDCTGEDCTVCAVLTVCENLLRRLSSAAAAAAIAIVSVSCALTAVRLFADAEHSATPVTLRVKLSD